MNSFETTHAVLSSLTQHEETVLRKRFRIQDDAINQSNGTDILPPSNGEDNGGSGGVPVPATPLD